MNYVGYSSEDIAVVIEEMYHRSTNHVCKRWTLFFLRMYARTHTRTHTYTHTHTAPYQASSEARGWISHTLTEEWTLKERTDFMNRGSHILTSPPTLGGKAANLHSKLYFKRVIIALYENKHSKLWSGD